MQIYDMDSFELKGQLYPAEGQSFPNEIQGERCSGGDYSSVCVFIFCHYSCAGGAFNPLDPGFLYLSVNTNCSVYKVDLRTGNVSFVLSDDYVYRPHEYEMEGITFWDLRYHHPDLGVMHLFGNFMTVWEKSIRSYTPVMQN